VEHRAKAVTDFYRGPVVYLCYKLIRLAVKLNTILIFNLDVLNTCSWVNRLVLIEAGSQIQAGSLIEAGGSDSIVLIQAGGFY